MPHTAVCEPAACCKIRERIDEAVAKVYRLDAVWNFNKGGGMMTEAVLVFFGLIIVAIVNFLGMRQIARIMQETKGKG